MGYLIIIASATVDWKNKKWLNTFVKQIFLKPYNLIPGILTGLTSLKEWLEYRRQKQTTGITTGTPSNLSTRRVNSASNQVIGYIETIQPASGIVTTGI